MNKAVTGVIGVVVVLFVLAYLAAPALGALQGAETNTQQDTFIAVEDDTDPEIVQLSRFPVHTGTDVVTVNATPVASPSYDLVNATGVLTLDDSVSDVGDTIVVTYDYTRNLTAFWPVLVIIAAIALLLLIWNMVQRKADNF
jgi:hypothetical protein